MFPSDPHVSQQTSSLSQKELERLEQALKAVWASPFVEDINGPLWETVFHYVKGLPIPDRLAPVIENLKTGKRGRAKPRKGTKRLFDAVDVKSMTGWSLKVLEWRTLAPGTNVEFIIQRAHALEPSKKKRRNKKSPEQPPLLEIHLDTEIENNGDPVMVETVSLSSPEEVLGRKLTEFWNNKVTGDKTVQGVVTPRLGLLVKSEDRKDYVFIEEAISTFDPQKLTWSWTEEKAALQAKNVDTGRLVLKWYHSQKQFFQSLPIPAGASSIHIEPKRLTAAEYISGITALLANPPTT